MQATGSYLVFHDFAISRENENNYKMQHDIHSGDAPKPSIIFEDVWKSFDGVSVLRGLSLSVPENATTVIIGRSGAGKSVTLKLILGTEDIDSGKITIDGQVVSTMKAKQRAKFSCRRVGMLFQSSALFDSMTIEENVAFSLENSSHEERETIFPEKKMAEIVEDALDKVGLSGFQKKYPSELSGGQKRRAALARLVVYRPKILLFDEPTTGLDPVTAMQINELIIETQKRLNTTCIVVTHDLVSALTVGDYFALHHEGIITAFGTRKNFFETNDPLLRIFVESAMVNKQDRKLLETIEGGRTAS